eukprot:CAMPEP_0117492920 /NCGR_PEP_ID=MMETSP0784-20121206/18832_1 /TAXON_ID=39447 /ORGANISM="" /LENGTH=309 /DNA_ID=CAMNT_0005287759 /DNA_START=100 /DNA_END=1029 /DNA_ORIENTATION=-
MTMEASRRAKGESCTLGWCVATLVVLYLVGGGVFTWLERDAELATYEKHRDLFKQMRELYEFDRCGEVPFSHMDFCKQQQEFKGMLEEFFERAGTEMKDHKKWTFFGSAFYITTLVTTLGYGNLHPQTPGGQLFTVLFGLIGIPAMGFVLSHIGQLVVNVWMPACPLALETRTKRIVVLSSLMVMFILLGGFVFTFMEGWSLLESLYFSACTLMSIGFGDLLPQRPGSRVATVVFIMLGLGVAASLIAILQIHVEIRGEHFARRLDDWYDTVASECSRGVGTNVPRATEAMPTETSPLLPLRGIQASLA